MTPLNEAASGERSASGGDAKQERESGIAGDLVQLPPLQGPSGLGGEQAGCGREAPAPAAPALPCPPSDQLKETTKTKTGLRTSGADVGRRFELEVGGAIQKFGGHRVAVLTTTPGDVVDGQFQKVHEYAEASRRWNSLNTGALQGRWMQWALVMQRHKDGGVHFHVCVVHREDIRGNLNFAEVKQRIYRTANDALKAEWEFLREVMPRYGFGPRVEFLPVMDVESLGRYLARYLRKEIGRRRKCDRRARLLRYSLSWERTVQGAFSWCDRRSLRAKARAEEIGTKFFRSPAAMENELGKAWKWKLRRLLWCADGIYNASVFAIERELEFYGGFEFAMQAVFAEADERARHEAELKAAFRSDCRAPVLWPA